MTHDNRVFDSLFLIKFGTVSGLAGALAVAIISAVAMPSKANAQYYYSSPYGYGGPGYRQPRYYVKKRKRRRSSRSSRSRSSKRTKTYTQIVREPVSDVLVLVSIKKQNIHVYDKDGLVAKAPISSGRRGMDTPKGIFTILQKNKRHFSNLYQGAPMPNMQRITWSGIAMHGGPLPGYPASHGCIRLPYSFATKLFDITNMHGRVIVSDDALEPKTIQDARLFQPLPNGSTTLTRASNETANADHVTVAEIKQATRIDGDPGTVIGVGRDGSQQVALAEIDPDRVVRANKYRQKRLQLKAENDRELHDAEDDFKLFQIDAKRTAAQLAEKRKALKAGNASVSERKKIVQKADYVAKKAHDDLKAFDRKYRNVSRRMTGDKLNELATKEKELDTRMLRLSEAAEASHHELRRAEMRIAGLKSNVDLAEQTHKSAVAKLAPVKKRLNLARVAIEKYNEEEKQRAKPVSIFISGKTGQLYARQGWFPILDIPVKIKNPNTALGTHVFTAIDSKTGGNKLEWNLVTVEDGRDSAHSGSSKYKKHYGKKQGLKRIRAEGSTAKMALDRIDIPLDARDQIEDLIKAGSSIIISDYPKSIETGQHTDFIILTQ